MDNLRLVLAFFSVPFTGSTPILLQEGNDSYLVQNLFGAKATNYSYLSKNKNPNDKGDRSEAVRV